MELLGQPPTSPPDLQYIAHVTQTVTTQAKFQAEDTRAVEQRRKQAFQQQRIRSLIPSSRNDEKAPQEREKERKKKKKIWFAR